MTFQDLDTPKVITSEIAQTDVGKFLVRSAESVFGEAERWRDIADYNTLDVFSNVIPNSKVVVPVLKELAPGLVKDASSQTLRESITNLIKGRQGYEQRLTKLENVLGIDPLSRADNSLDRLEKLLSWLY